VRSAVAGERAAPNAHGLAARANMVAAGLAEGSDWSEGPGDLSGASGDSPYVPGAFREDTPEGPAPEEELVLERPDFSLKQAWDAAEAKARAAEEAEARAAAEAEARAAAEAHGRGGEGAAGGGAAAAGTEAKEAKEAATGAEAGEAAGAEAKEAGEVATGAEAGEAAGAEAKEAAADTRVDPVAEFRAAVQARTGRAPAARPPLRAAPLGADPAPKPAGPAAPARAVPGDWDSSSVESFSAAAARAAAVPAQRVVAVPKDPCDALFFGDCETFVVAAGPPAPRDGAEDARDASSSGARTLSFSLDNPHLETRCEFTPARPHSSAWRPAAAPGAVPLLTARLPPGRNATHARGGAGAVPPPGLARGLCRRGDVRIPRDAATLGDAIARAAERVQRAAGPPPSPRTNRTRRVLHPVLIGHATSLTP